MSLHLAAKHLAAHGRGPDTTLVHMTPKEVAGLQALAQQHGGSLTVNPQTGLPEAGFLSSILPLVAGVGLTAMGMPAGMAALTVGGGTALATGDLGKGLMAGLGAYGGSGLAESLISSGASAVTPQVAATAANAVPTETAAQIAESSQAGLTVPSAMEPAVSSPLTKLNPYEPYKLGSNVSGETLKASDFGTPTEGLAVRSPQYTTPITTTTSPYSNANNITPGGPMSGPSISQSTYPAQPPSFKDMTSSQRLDALKAGATGENVWNYAKENPLKAAGMLAPLMSADSENNNPNAPAGDSDRGAMANAGYQYDPGWRNPLPAPNPYGREQIYSRPRFYIPKAADGGAVQHFDDGGVVARTTQDPLLQQFVNAQAEKIAQTAPTPVDVKQQFADYLKAQTSPADVIPTSTPGASSTAQTAALTTSNVSALTPQDTGPVSSRALSTEQLAEKNDPNAWGNLSDSQKADYFANPKSTIFGIPAIDIQEKFQSGWAASPFGKVQNYFAPQEQGRAENITSAARMQQALANAPQQNLSYITQNPFDTGRGISASDSSPIGLGNQSSETRSALRSNEGYGDGSGDGDGGGEANGGLMDSHYAQGGISSAYNLGSYSDGGRLLRGPGDGVSDSIPAVIGQKQPARLADGEFVIPARIVSEIGNGSTEAGARKLYAMMDKVQNARKATVGKGKVAKNTRADRYLPA